MASESELMKVGGVTLMLRIPHTGEIFHINLPPEGVLDLEFHLPYRVIETQLVAEGTGTAPYDLQLRLASPQPAAASAPAPAPEAPAQAPGAPAAASLVAILAGATPDPARAATEEGKPLEAAKSSENAPGASAEPPKPRVQGSSKGSAKP